jgi:hypothetical protein
MSHPAAIRLAPSFQAPSFEGPEPTTSSFDDDAHQLTRKERRFMRRLAKRQAARLAEAHPDRH